MLKKWEVQLSRAVRLSSERTMYQGACRVSVAWSIRSRAREYSYQRRKDSRSIGLSFHCRIGALIRAMNRRSCSFSRCVPPFENDDDADSFILHPILELA